MNHGYFVNFDGPNGTGKTSAMRAVAKRLRDIGYDVVETREPGGTELAEKLRGLILDSSNQMDTVTQLLLFNAARRSHLQQVIEPAVEAGKIVLCDRFLASSLVFQSLNPDGSANLSDEFIIDAHMKFCGGRMPDFSVYLHAPLEVRRERLSGRAAAQGATPDRFEEYDDRFDIAAAEKFLECGPKIDRDHVVIDAVGTPEEVAELACQAVLARLCTLRYGALYWSQMVERWIAVMDPLSRGSQPLLVNDPDHAQQAAEVLLQTKPDAEIRIVSETEVKQTIARNLRQAA